MRRRPEALERRLEPRFVTTHAIRSRCVAGAHVDVARVGQPRHGDLGDPSRDLVAVERRGEQLARLGEQPQPVVGPLAVGDLDDQPADPDRLAIGRANRVVAREPVAALADVQGCVVGRLRMDDRLARLDHLPVERLERRGERRDHLGERSPDVRLGWEPVQGGERVVDTDETKLAIPEADPDRRRAEHGVELGVRLLGRLEEERVVDRKRSASRDLVRDLEIGGTEATPRLAGSERDRPEQAAARLERDDDVRERSERLVEGQMLLVHRGLLQLAGTRVFDEIRLTCPEHLRNGVGVVGLRRVPAPELAEQLLSLAAPVRDDDLPQRPVLVERIDDAVVRDARYQEPRQIRERRLVVERRGEQRARLGEEVEPRLGVALLGDVPEDVDHELDVALGRQDRRRADDRPAFVAARAQPVAKHRLVGGVGDERAPAREVVDREWPAVLAEDLEPREELRAREGEHFLRRLEATQPRGGVVRVDESSVLSLRGDPIADVPENRGELAGGGDDLPGAHTIDRGLLAVCRFVGNGTRQRDHKGIGLWPERNEPEAIPLSSAGGGSVQAEPPPALALPGREARRCVAGQVDLADQR